MKQVTMKIQLGFDGHTSIALKLLDTERCEIPSEKFKQSAWQISLHVAKIEIIVPNADFSVKIPH